MVRKLVVFALAVALLAAGSGWAVAQEASPKPRGEHRGQKFQTWLGLSDEQMAQIRAIRERDAETRKQMVQALRTAQAELRRLALEGTDPAQLQAKQSEVQQLLGQLVELRVQSLQEIGPLLTAEQREKLAEAKGPGFRHHRGHRGPRAPVS